MSDLPNTLSEKQLSYVIKQCMTRDRYRLRGQLRRLKKDDTKGLSCITTKSRTVTAVGSTASYSCTNY